MDTVAAILVKSVSHSLKQDEDFFGPGGFGKHVEDEFYKDYPYVERHNYKYNQSELPNFDEDFYEACACTPGGHWRNGEIQGKLGAAHHKADSKIREVKSVKKEDPKTGLDMIKTREDAKHKNLEKFDPSDQNLTNLVDQVMTDE